ncbi:MAG: hypothetical protein AB1489_19785 [Acidobacteriota bacterium]
MKKIFHRNTLIVVFVLALMLLSVPTNMSVSAQATTTNFTATYRGQGSNSSTCNTTFNIVGQEPSASGTYPVFVYTVGTNENFTSSLATAAVNGMAQRGFVAATIQYANGQFGTCSQISGKAECIYDANSATSAITTLCNRPKADCNKGIVVAGFSQGSVIADLAKNFDARVEAAWGMGDGVSYTFLFNLRSCLANGNRALASDRLRAINGQRDIFVGSNTSGVRSQLQTLTGFNCGSSALSCLQNNGSGWYIVQDGQTQDGRADHCYMFVGGCTGNLDPNFVNGNAPFCLNPNLDWLKNFARP